MVEARRAQVYLPATERRAEVTGARAEVIALVATLEISDKVLALVVALIGGRRKIDAFKSGRVEVDISPGKMHLYTREGWPRVLFDDPDDSADGGHTEAS